MTDTTNPAAPADATASTATQQTESQAPVSGTGAPAHDTAPDGQRQQADGRSEAASTDASQTQEPKPPSRYKRRVETLTSERDSAIRQAEYYRGLAERGGQPRKLDPLSFNSDADYQRAVIEDTARRSHAEFARTQASTAVEQQAMLQQEIWTERAAEFRETAPDFDQIAVSPNVPYSHHGIEMVRQHPDGPRIAYYLGKNPAEARRLASMNPLETAFALGEMSARLRTAQPRTMSQAPAPVQTVRGGGVLGTPDPSKMEMAQYAAWYAQRNQRGATRH